MKAKEGIVLDRNGDVVFGESQSKRRGPVVYAWGSGGLVPKLILGGAIGAFLFFGFGIIVAIFAVLILTTLLRAVFSVFRR